MARLGNAEGAFFARIGISRHSRQKCRFITKMFLIFDEEKILVRGFFTSSQNCTFFFYALFVLSCLHVSWQLCGLLTVQSFRSISYLAGKRTIFKSVYACTSTACSSWKWCSVRKMKTIFEGNRWRIAGRKWDRVRTVDRERIEFRLRISPLAYKMQSRSDQIVIEY